MKITYKQLNEVSFFIAYFFFLVFSLMGHIPIFTIPLKFLTNISLCVLAINIVFNSKIYTGKEVFILLMLLFIACLQIQITKDFGLFKFTLFVAAAKVIDLKKCIKFDKNLRSILIISVVCLSVIGISPDIVSYYDGNFRHSLGFTNPNALGLAILILCMEICYLNKFNLSLKNFIVILFLLIFEDYYAGSRTTTLVILLLLIFSIIYKYKPMIFEKKIVKKFIINNMVFQAIITVGSTYMYMQGNKIISSLNLLLSYRISNTAKYFQEVGVTLLGFDINIMNLALDNVYAFLLFNCGIIFFIVFLFASIKLFRKLYAMKDYSMILVMLCFAIYGLSERLWIYIDYNIFMLAFSYIIYNRKLYR